MLLKNIKGLVQARTKVETHSPLSGENIKRLPIIENAFLLLEEDRIKAFGKMEDCPAYDGEVIDAKGRFVLPTWVDSHTHLVFAAPREEEFVMRLKGKSYQECPASFKILKALFK